MRVDQLLVHRGLAATRAQAQQLVSAGVQWRVGGDWRRVAKNGEVVPEDAQLRLLDPEVARYVSRGGLKLEGALAATGLRVAGASALDVGQSTGGFTDCLLQHGAALVMGVDVGQGQLHPRLAHDDRVCALEKINARELDARALLDRLHGDIQATPDFAATVRTGFDVAVGDVSFISLTLVLPAVVPLVRPGGQLLMLVKPQFELQPGQVGKGGIVRDASLYPVVRQRIEDCLGALNLRCNQWLDSCIEGGDGNREFFVHATRNN